jgi:hypothetical protein
MMNTEEFSLADELESFKGSIMDIAIRIDDACSSLQDDIEPDDDILKTGIPEYMSLHEEFGSIREAMSEAHAHFEMFFEVMAKLEQPQPKLV